MKKTKKKNKKRNKNIDDLQFLQSSIHFSFFPKTIPNSISVSTNQSKNSGKFLKNISIEGKTVHSFGRAFLSREKRRTKTGGRTPRREAWLVHVGIVSTLREAVVRKRSRGEKEIYRGGTASSGTLFYANRVSFFLVSRRLLNEGEEESTVLATRSLHYHISDAICSTGINAHRYFLPPLPWQGITG